MKKLELEYARVVQMYHGVAAMESNMAAPQNVNIESPHDSAIPLLGEYTKPFKADA